MTDVLAEGAQRVVSLLPLRRRDHGREPGISAMMRVAGKEPWMDLSLRSVRDLVDEVVVVDSSGDETVAAAVETARGAGMEVVHLQEDLDICDASNRALAASRHAWFLQWDADFVAHTDGPQSAARLRERILGLPRRYYIVGWPMECLDVDLFHQLPRHVQWEEWLFTYHPAARYRRRGPFEWRTVPLFFKPRRWTETYGVHLRTVKPPRTLLKRHYRPGWMASGSPLSLEAYMRPRLEREFGTSEVDEAAELLVARLRKRVQPYTGEYPALLRPRVRKAGKEVP